jgi:hypothetical protein
MTVITLKHECGQELAGPAKGGRITLHQNVIHRLLR